NPALMLREHIDPKPFPRMKVGVSSSLVTHTHKHQHRIQRDRGKGIGGHAFHFAVVINSDDGDPSGEASHRATEFVLSSAHLLNQICTTNTGFRACWYSAMILGVRCIWQQSVDRSDRATWIAKCLAKPKATKAPFLLLILNPSRGTRLGNGSAHPILNYLIF